MRRGETYKNASQEVMRDSTFIQDKLNSTAPTRGRSRDNRGKRQNKQPYTPEKHARREERSSGWRSAEKKSRRDQRSKERTTSYHKDNTSSTADDKCNGFQTGKCNNEWCKWEHECRICGRTNHDSSSCYQNPENKSQQKGGKSKDKGKGKDNKQRNGRDSWKNN